MLTAHDAFSSPVALKQLQQSPTPACPTLEPGSPHLAGQDTSQLNPLTLPGVSSRHRLSWLPLSFMHCR